MQHDILLRHCSLHTRHGTSHSLVPCQTTAKCSPLQDRARQHEQAAAALRVELRRAENDRACQAAEAAVALKHAEAAAAANQNELVEAGSACQDAEGRAAAACAESARCACICLAETCLV